MNTDGTQSTIIGWLVIAAMVAFAIVIAVTLGGSLDIARAG